MNSKTAGVTGIIAIIFFIIAYVVTDGEILQTLAGADGAEPAADVLPAPGAPPILPQWYEIYFTNPTCPPLEQRTGGLDELIAEDLSLAEVAVDIAAFELDSEPITNALIALEARGVPVRVVTDTDYADESAVRRLRRNGISVVEDKGTALMHNKFIVIDGQIVWTGSMNFTSNGVYCNNNNLVRLVSAELAVNYRTEMSEMYDDRLFGASSPRNTPHEKLTIDGVDIESYFAPEAKLVPRILAELAKADSEILFMAFSFTHEDLGEAILDLAGDGIDIRGVFETSGSESVYSYYGDMVDIDLPNLQVRQDGNPRVMHHKVFIIDRRTVIFGSYNFSRSANRNNDENLLVVHDAQFAGYFVEEFEAVWAEAKTGTDE